MVGLSQSVHEWPAKIHTSKWVSFKILQSCIIRILVHWIIAQHKQLRALLDQHIHCVERILIGRVKRIMPLQEEKQLQIYHSSQIKSLTFHTVADSSPTGWQREQRQLGLPRTTVNSRWYLDTLLRKVAGRKVVWCHEQSMILTQLSQSIGTEKIRSPFPPSTPSHFPMPQCSPVSCAPNHASSQLMEGWWKRAAGACGALFAGASWISHPTGLSGR